MAEDRRGFLRAAGLGLGAAAFGVVGMPPVVRAAGTGRYGIAFTSFAIRLRQGRDILRDTGAPSLSADAFIDLLLRFEADGGQMDITQLVSTEDSYLDGLKHRIDGSKLFLELAVGGPALEDEARFAEVARVARRLGVTRLRVALGRRRYEDYTRDAWSTFAARWRTALPRAKGFLERHELKVGIENHRDWHTGELVDLIRSVDSPFLGACVDFGNQVSFLEDPLETITALAPYAVTTHLKDMALRRYESGFELSEVPLGEGVCPLGKMIEVLERARPGLPICLEMITRDPTKVPYRDEAYWASLGVPRDAPRVSRFEAELLSRARKDPLPRVSGLALEAMVAKEDENVRLCTDFARKKLRL
ncbi:MAG: sugar phosphate isomerase/epimerase family protein [Burkholderiales bacterium]